jgi:predicted ABC-type ATPase
MTIAKPKLIVIAGPNGSGKTSVTTQILKHKWVENCVYINPDNIAQELFGDWNSPEAVLKAAQFATQQRESCLKNGESFIFETVFSALDKVDFLQKAQESGFFIRLFFVGTNHPAINASRIARRVMEGGHDVPISKIISRYYKSINNACLIAPYIDRLYVYDNSLEYLPASLLFRANNGILEKVYTTVNEWATPILNVVSKEIKNI